MIVGILPAELVAIGKQLPLYGLRTASNISSKQEQFSLQRLLTHWSALLALAAFVHPPHRIIKLTYVKIIHFKTHLHISAPLTPEFKRWGLFWAERDEGKGWTKGDWGGKEECAFGLGWLVILNSKDGQTEMLCLLCSLHRGTSAPCSSRFELRSHLLPALHRGQPQEQHHPMRLLR